MKIRKKKVPGKRQPTIWGDLNSKMQNLLDKAEATTSKENEGYKVKIFIPF